MISTTLIILGLFNPSIGDVIDRYEASFRSLTSVEFEYEIKDGIRFFNQKDKIDSANTTISRGKIICDRTRGFYRNEFVYQRNWERPSKEKEDETQIVTFDGSLTTVLRNSKGNWYARLIPSAKPVKLGVSGYLTLFPVLSTQSSVIGPWLHEAKTLSSSTISHRGPISVVQRPDDIGTGKVSYTFDETFGGMQTKYEHRAASNIAALSSGLTVITFLDFCLLDKMIWLPQKANLSAKVDSVGFVYDSTSEATVIKYTLNKPYPPAFFQASIPDGTEVFDERTGRLTIHRRTSDAAIKESVERAKSWAKELDAVPPIALEIRQASWFSMPAIFSFAAITALVIGSIIYCVRRRSGYKR